MSKKETVLSPVLVGADLRTVLDSNADATITQTDTADLTGAVLGDIVLGTHGRATIYCQYKRNTTGTCTQVNMQVDECNNGAKPWYPKVEIGAEGLLTDQVFPRVIGGAEAARAWSINIDSNAAQIRLRFWGLTANAADTLDVYVVIAD